MRTYEDHKNELYKISDIQLIDMARKELRRICEGGQFRMCIPVQIDDSDIIFSEIIKRFETRLIL